MKKHYKLRYRASGRKVQTPTQALEPYSVQPPEHNQAVQPEFGQAATLLHCLAVRLYKHTAEENPGLSPKEKALLLSYKAALTPKERTIGNESWTENQFQQETGWSLLKLSSRIHHCNNPELCSQGATAPTLAYGRKGEGNGSEKPQPCAGTTGTAGIAVGFHFNEILIYLCLSQRKDEGCFSRGTWTKDIKNLFKKQW